MNIATNNQNRQGSGIGNDLGLFHLSGLGSPAFFNNQSDKHKANRVWAIRAAQRGREYRCVVFDGRHNEAGVAIINPKQVEER